MKQALANPLNWRHLSRPAVPSWGEPYENIVARMTAAMADAWERVDGGDVVVVSHQLPIWVTHLALSHQPT
ncbi:histidine phosphatase family protein, partial [Vibrio parahaemolyticus]|nr:histidine phosphatase family protein [Vibrio parahaemolyticus]